MKKTLLRMISLVIAAALALPLYSCGQKYDFPESTEEEADIILKIGDYEVPFEQYRYFFMNYKAEYDEGLDSYWRTHDKEAAFYEIDALVRESLLTCYATFALAADIGIDYRGGEVQKEVMNTIYDDIEEKFGGFDEYLAALGSAYINHSVYRFAITELEVEERLFASLKENGTILTDEATVRASLANGDFCHAKQILIMNNEDSDTEENRKTAENVLSLAQLGSDFDRLVATYGQDPTMITNPEGYYFTYGQLIESFEEAAFALGIGEISGIVESPLGYHIILRLELDPDYVEANFAELTSAYAARRFHEEVDKKAETLTITETELWHTFTLDDFFYNS